MRVVSNSMRGLLSLLFLLFCVISCRKMVEIDSLEKQLFLEETAIGAYKDGHEYMVYKRGFHQLALNPRRHTFRIQADRQEEYFHLRLESYPRSLGVHVISSFEMKKGEILENYSFLFECSKMEGGKIWLWNKENKLGVILPEH